MSEMEDDLSVGDGNDSTDPNHGISYSYARALSCLQMQHTMPTMLTVRADPEVKPVRMLE